MSLIETKEVRFYSSVDDFPQVGNELCVADGTMYVVSGGVSSSISMGGGFIPSIYSAPKTATTTAASEAVATGAQKLMAVNEDATNSVYIGYGNSQAEAETNATSGVPGATQYLLLPKSTLIEGIKGYSHYAWKSSAGSVSLIITQGV